MYRIPGVLSAATAVRAPAAARIQPTRGPALQDHDRIAAGLNDMVVGRLLAVGLDLQAALGLMGDHPASAKICHARDELDQATLDIRDAIFDHLGSEPPARHDATP
jgi:hypothetical protein